jgi:hypothetical protein
MLTPRQAFAAGFALCCAERSIPASAIDSLAQLALEKRAILDVAGPAATAAGNLIGLAIAAPLGLGYAGGYGLAKLRDADVNADDLKNQELITEYRRLAAAARRVAESKRRARLEESP